MIEIAPFLYIILRPVDVGAAICRPRATEPLRHGFALPTSPEKQCCQLNDAFVGTAVLGGPQMIVELPRTAEDGGPYKA